MSDFEFQFKHSHPYPHCTCAACEGARLGAKMVKKLAAAFGKAIKDAGLEIVIRKRKGASHD